MKRLYLILAVSILALTLASCGSDSPQASQPTTQTQAQNTPQATAKPLSTSQQISQIVSNAGLLGKPQTTYGFADTPKGVLIKDNIGNGNLTNGLTVGEIKLECFNAQKALWTSHLKPQISEVLVQTTMNVVDQYGKASNALVSTCDLTSATEQKFVWQNLFQDQAWDVYDNTTIAPFLTK